MTDEPLHVVHIDEAHDLADGATPAHLDEILRRARKTTTFEEFLATYLLWPPLPQYPTLEALDDAVRRRLSGGLFASPPAGQVWSGPRKPGETP